MSRAVVITAFLLMSCTAQTSGENAAATPSPSSSSRPSSQSSAATAAPSTSPLASVLTCPKPYAAPSAAAIFEFPNAQGPILEVADVTNPARPMLMCTLTPAQGGQFDRYANQVLFWAGDRLGSVNLNSGQVSQIAQLPARAADGAFDATGSKFAYRVFDDAGGFTTHIFQLGVGDRVLYTQPPIGGHGGPVGGPLDQLQFSPDGTELLDYWEFRSVPGLPKLQVFKTDGTVLFQVRSDARSGAWAPTGASLYFFMSNPPTPLYALEVLDSSGATQIVATNVNGSDWPAMDPSGAVLLYTAFDASAPGSATGGMPHVWRVNLPTFAADQVGTDISSRPRFVSTTAYWSDEERPCNCGPGGASQPDGVLLVHRFVGSPTDEVVDWRGMLPGIGGLTWPDTDTSNVLDIWPRS